MLVIRQEQVKVFEQAAARQFRCEMIEHLKTYAPKHCGRVGDVVLGQLVDSGVDRAEKYGLTNYGPVQFFLELMIFLGWEFDTDPQYPWIASTLANEEVPDQMEKAGQLHAKYLDYIEKVIGPQYQFEKEAIRRMVRERFEDLPSSTSDFVTYANRIYPEKVEYLGKSSIRGLLPRARDCGTVHQMTRESDTVVLLLFMFAFGHGAPSDPQFPWIAETIQKSSPNNPEQRCRNLFSKGVAYLHGSLTNLEIT